ncbi:MULTISPECIES: DNA-3-methyladenine glycosylase [unclassified Sedimentibacter]|uniref:DNA-3-methyladenine glycosylase n=1 Tax=unclassified Sedimentibacter TaxID=2649220 RepID=UPI0027E10EAC|nr:DNA-3-methyladenine glycosylase [Sedimentibacter sp. MB35-C1]WMJ78403.1 DNA-3-methyladenine glycosylase [Sedimentibacter sp. MB35-C1]
MTLLPRSFYDRDARLVAEDLIGKVIVRSYEDNVIKVRITETEAYIADIDKASHGYGGKVTPRTKVMFGPPGYTYVYFIYGMYYCLNFVTEREGVCSAVLVRGAEPVENIQQMCINRYGRLMDDISKLQLKNLCNGPGKLCNALRITKDHNGIDLCGGEIYVEDDGFEDFSVNRTKRINIDYSEEAKDFLWRYIICK